MTLDRIAFAWGCSSWHGWGVIGLNLMLYWEGEALCLMPELSAELGLGDPRCALLSERLMQSLRYQRDMAERRAAGTAPVWVALGNDFEKPLAPWSVEWNCTAFPVFEDLAIAERNVDPLKSYPKVIAASRWNQEFLRAHGIDAKLCHQGYDPVLFNPGVRRKRDDGRFRVFSGGKAEWRKGQDLVVRAFARFAETHDDAVLVAAWGSPWPGLAQSFAEHGIEPPPGSHLGRPNFRAWAASYGIKPHQIGIVPPLPNWRMPEVYGNVDVALFPNRAEGGTNLVAMEVMACGVPTIFAMATGQRDLDPGPVAGNWPYLPSDRFDVECIVDGLEAAYRGQISERPLPDYWSWPTRLAELRRILEA